MQEKGYKTLSKFGSILMLSGLCACSHLFKQPVTQAPEPEPIVREVKQGPIKLINASKRDIKFAQSSLLKLGFKVGRVDGLWGPKSARAIREFESLNNLDSADGFLSELNLRWLERLTTSSRRDYQQKEKVVKKRGISALLSGALTFSEGPQLVIVDKEYNLFSKPNPFSSTLVKLSPGTGVYIIGASDGWYEIESPQTVW